MAYNLTVDTTLERVKRHPKYYLSGGDIHFLVGNYLFRVHRYFFERESAYFREKFVIAAPPGQQPKGSSDANAFPLEDVHADDFARFLWVFYNPKYSIYDATVEDWSVILKLSFDWRFAEVKKLCVRELEKFEIAPLHKIELYQMYELDKKLLIPSYIAMCMRPEPLSIKEGRQLGLETALLLAKARETARGKPSRSPGQLCSSPITVEDEGMVEIIRDVFGITLGPPSPSLTPLENTGTASASTIPALNGTTATSKNLQKLKTEPSTSDATTAVNTMFGLSSTPTAKDAKSPGQFTSGFTPTILDGRLNSVFSPIQGTVRPPPLEPPPRALSPAVQTPTVETPAAETPVLETPPPEKAVPAPKKELSKKEKEKEKKKRQQDKKAQKKAALAPQAAGERREEHLEMEVEVEVEPESDMAPPDSTSTGHVSLQSQADAALLVDITTSTPPTDESRQSESAEGAATSADKLEQASASAPDAAGERSSKSDATQRETFASESGCQGTQVEGERKEEEDVGTSMGAAASAPEPTQALSAPDAGDGQSMNEKGREAGASDSDERNSQQTEGGRKEEDDIELGVVADPTPEPTPKPEVPAIIIPDAPSTESSVNPVPEAPASDVKAGSEGSGATAEAAAAPALADTSATAPVASEAASSDATVKDENKSVEENEESPQGTDAAGSNVTDDKTGTLGIPEAQSDPIPTGSDASGPSADATSEDVPSSSAVFAEARPSSPASTQATMSLTDPSPPNARECKNDAVKTPTPATATSPPNAWGRNNEKITTPVAPAYRFTSMLAKFTSPASPSSDTKKQDPPPPDKDDIPGAWQDNSGNETSEPGSSESSKACQPPELTALANKAKNMSTKSSSDLMDWDFGEDEPELS